MKTSNNLENKTPSDIFWRVQLVCKKIGTITGIQSGPEAFDKSKFVMTFLTILEVTQLLYSFRLVLEWKIGKVIPESSRLEFLEKFTANYFALSEKNTTPPSRWIEEL